MVQEQRKIGQQIMAVRMIQAENEKVYRGGVSFLRVLTIANAMRVEEDEIKELIHYCDALDSRTIENKVAMTLADYNPDTYVFYRDCIAHYADWFFRIRFCNEKETYDQLINSIQQYIDTSDYKTTEMEITVDLIIKGLYLYQLLYFEVIDEMRNRNYDWTVITEMITEDSMWRVWMEEEDEEDAYARLKQVIKPGI